MDKDELPLSQVQQYDNVVYNMRQSYLTFVELSHLSEPRWMHSSQPRNTTSMSEHCVCFALEVLQVLKKKTVSPRTGFSDIENRGGLVFVFVYKLRKGELLR